jgi:integrase
MLKWVAQARRGVQRIFSIPTRDKMNDERKHLTGREIEKLLAEDKGARHEARDRCLLVMLFWHGLRVSEALALKLNVVDLDGRTLHVTRLKKG